MSSFHALWNDGARDSLSGGTGNDQIYVSADNKTDNYIFSQDGVMPPQLSADVFQTLRASDLIDGSDPDYVLNGQLRNYYDSSQHIWFSINSTTVATALSSGPNWEGFGYFLGGVSSSDANELGPALGMKIDDVDAGQVLMVFADGGDFTGVVAAITITRDYGDAGDGPWIVSGKDPSAAAVAGGASALTAITGNDTLMGGNSVDEVYGFGGDDTIILSAYSGGSDIVDGGDGVDTADYTGVTANLVVSLASGTVTGLGTGNDDSLISVENVTTGSGADDITGSSGANTIRADGGTDTVHGGSGNDVIYGGGGADQMFGEMGSDTYYVENTADVVTELSGQGMDTVHSTVNYTLSNNVEYLVLQEPATTGTGNALNNQLTGNTLNNILDGAAGADTMIGGLGDDTYYVDSATDVVTENANEGTADLVVSSVSISSLALNVEKLTLATGTTNLDGTGNGLANTITGNGGINQLNGANGADTINAGGGNDVLNGGALNDTLMGGAGADKFVFSVGGGADTITDFHNGGADVIDLSGVSEITGFNNLKANHYQDMGTYSVIRWNGGADSITLNGIDDVTDLAQGDFIFA